MIANLAANLLVLIHFGFILFVVLGGLLVLKWRKIAYLHIPCVLWGALIEVGGWLCPLTPLELHLRQLAGDAGYTGGFIDHYVMPLVYPPGLTRGMQLWIGTIVVLVNLCVYAWVVWNRSKRSKGRLSR
jgi:hypothetical protein